MTRPASYGLVWAVDATSDQMGGETATADQSVIQDGWIGNATAEPPTARMQNYWQTRVDLGLQEIEQQGFLSWRSDVPYVIGAVITYAGSRFEAAQASINVQPQGSTDTGIWTLIPPGQWPTTPANLTGIVPVAKGGTGSNGAAGARGNLGAAASGANADITSLSGLTTPLSIAQGGTSANSASGARSALGLGSAATYTAGNTPGNLAPLGWDYAVDSGVANAYVLALSPAITTYAEPLKVRGRVAHTSTGACTLNAGAGAIPMVGLGHSALQGGEMFAGGYFEADYIAALGKFVLLFCSGAPEQVSNATQSQHAITAAQVQAGFGSFATDTGTTNTIVANFSPALSGLTQGMPFRVLIATGNTGATTININGLGAIAVLGLAGAALQGGELVGGGMATFVYAAGFGCILLSCQAAALQVAPAVNSKQAVQLGQLLATMTGSDYLKIPVVVSGVVRTLIIQWCSSASIAAGATGSVTLPLTFPNAALFAIAAPAASSGNSNAGNVVAGAPTTSSVPLYNWGSAIAAPAKVLAIGW